MDGFARGGHMGAYRNGWCLRVVSIAIFILLAIPAVAQLPTATILGTAKDSSGGVLPTTTVTITNVDTGFKRTVMTGDDGSYRVVELPVGHYEVRGEHTGFKTETRKGITLDVTDQAVVNLTLEVGSEAQQVIVTGEASAVNTQNATLGGLVTETNIENLPLNGRNYVDLSLLQPGVSPDRNIRDAGTSFSVNGAPPRSNNFTLDGAILQNTTGRNPAAGDSGDSLGVDGIREYRIVTGIFQAEYGLAMGSQMVAVSKGGTNQFHGDVFEYLRNSRLDAKNFFDDPNAKIPEFQRNQFGGAFGGPIKKEKSFFFGVYEGLRENLGTTNNNLVPSKGCHGNAGDVITQTACPDFMIDNTPSATVSPYTAPFLALVPLPTTPFAVNSDGSFQLATKVFGDHDGTRENYGQMRVDQNFSTADTFFGRYTIDNAILDQTVGDYSYFRSLGSARNQWITLAENHIFSPSVLNTARFSFSRTRTNTSTNNVGLPNGGLGPAIVTGFPTGVVDMNGSAGGTYTEFGSSNNYPINFDLQNIYTLSDDLLLTRGKHAFKFGVLLNRFNSGHQASNSANGQIQFNTLADFLQSQPYLVEFQPTFANENRFYIFDTAGFYGQDDWRATQRLTLNLGLRYEFMTTPRELNGRVSRLLNDFTDAFTLGPIIKNNTLHDFSPRVGLAYDLFGNGKTALHAGGGVYYDLGNIGSVLGENTTGAPPFSGLIDITNSSCPTIADWEAPFGTTPSCFTTPPSAPFPSLGTNGHWPFPIPAAVINYYTPQTAAGVTPSYMDYNYKSPYMVQYTVSVQQQLPWDMAVGVAYVGNHGVHLATIREGNPVFPTLTLPCGDPASRCVNGVVPFWDNGDPTNYHPVNPNIGSSINIGTFAESRYNGLQVVVNKRTGHGLEFQAAYTRSRVTDDTQGQENVRDCVVSGGLLGIYPLAPQTVDTGPACFNIKNNWEISTTYHLPDLMKGNAFLSKIASGWELSSIVTIESGEPFSLITGANRSNSGVLQGGQGDRVNINTPALIAKYFNPSVCTSMPGQPAAGNNPCVYTPIPYDPNTVLTGNINQWYNPAMFSNTPVTLSSDANQTSCFFMAPDPNNPCTPNTVGQLGTSGRNFLPGPPFRNWDFSLMKETKLGFLGEAGLVQFRVEFFNILNHPNFGPPSAGIFAGGVTGTQSGGTSGLGPFSQAPDGGAGQISTTQGKPRQIQFALRVEF
jgi:hypothetical protein